MMFLSIVIPTYNERDNVSAIATRIREVLLDAPYSYEIWFVDDSTDDTVDVLRELSLMDPHVHYLHRSGERGLGTAVVEGFKRSEGDLIVVMDADLQHPPELLPVIVSRLQEGIDVVVPSRFVDGGSDGGLGAIRKLVSWTARGIGRLAIRRLRSVTDCTGGYFGLHRSVIKHTHLNPIGWKILMEVLVKGQYQTLHEIPYAFHARDLGQSKMSVREQWNYLLHVVSLVASSPEDRRFYLFCTVGALGMVVNLLVMTLLLVDFHWGVPEASVAASVVAMIHNFLWNDRVTWRGHAHPVRWRRWMQVPLFMAISSLSIVITALSAHLFALKHASPVVGQWVGIVVATGWSYMANNRWTWTSAIHQEKSLRSPAVCITREDLR